MNELSQAYLQPTPMLDFLHDDIQKLIDEKQWKTLSRYDAIGAIYHFVRDDIRFGYNSDDRLAASKVLKDGYGQCNTKGTLLMALLRSVGIETRLHGFTIYNELQRGAIPTAIFRVAPERIIHSWVEVYQEGRWVNLEGYILDSGYLRQVQQRFSAQQDAFSGYAISTKNLAQPDVDWKGDDTYIQSEGIADDFGVYPQPDDFYSKYGSNLSGVKKVLYRYVLRHIMNLNVSRIRLRGIGQKAS